MTPLRDARDHAVSVRENDKLILERLMGMLHQLPRREREAVLAGASFMYEADRLRDALEEIILAYANDTRATRIASAALNA